MVDAFAGALPESTIRQWLEGIMPTPAEKLATEAFRLEPTDPAGAESRYREAIGLPRTIPTSKPPLAGCCRTKERSMRRVQTNRRAGSARILEPEAEAVKAGLALREQGEATGGVAACARRSPPRRATPRRLQLAEALAASGTYEEALELALAVVEEGKADSKDEARRVMVNIFQLLPADSNSPPTIAASFPPRLLGNVQVKAPRDDHDHDPAATPTATSRTSSPKAAFVVGHTFDYVRDPLGF